MDRRIEITMHEFRYLTWLLSEHLKQENPSQPYIYEHEDRIDTSALLDKLAEFTGVGPYR